MTYFAPIYPISHDQLMALSTAPAAQIRIGMSNKPVDWKIPKKKAEDLMKAAGCMLL